MPPRPPLALPRVPLAVPLTALVALAALTALVLGRWAPLVRFDTAAEAWARTYGHQHPGWIAVLRVVTDIAATIPFFAIGLALTAGLLIFRRYREAAAAGAVTAFVSAGWSLGHALLYRPRPAQGFVSPNSNGFPSGHTANAAGLALLGVLLLWPRLHRAGRAVAIVVAVLFAGFIGLTRVALLAHWPSDVVGGWLLGVVVVPLCVMAVRRVGARELDSGNQ
jgi:undecaprenyl-diphosphatase